MLPSGLLSAAFQNHWIQLPASLTESYTTAIYNDYSTGRLEGSTTNIGNIYPRAISEDFSTAIIRNNVYINSNNLSWTFQNKLVNPSGPNNKQIYTIGISKDGNTVALCLVSQDSPFSSFNDNPFNGAVSVFERINNEWVRQATLTNAGIVPGSENYQIPISNFLTSDNFGQNIGLSNDGNTLVVGAPGTLTGGGAVKVAAKIYTYVRSGGVWAQEQVISPPPELETKFFGSSIKLSGDGNTMLVLISDSDPEIRSRIYTRTAGVWSQAQELTPKQPLEQHFDISENGNTIIYNNKVFTKSGGSWSITDTLVLSNSTFSSVPSAITKNGGLVALRGIQVSGTPYTYWLSLFNSVGDGTFLQSQARIILGDFNPNFVFHRNGSILSFNSSDTAIINQYPTRFFIRV